MAASDRELPGSVVQTASTRVLLVEDEALDALAVTRSLRPEAGWRERFDVRCTRTLAQGLEQLGRAPVDVVLLDLCLPDSDAEQTIARIRALDRRTPLVVFTGCEDAEVAARAFEAGADDLLVKGDLEPGLLRRTLRHAIERRRATRGAARPRAYGRRSAADRSLLHHLKNVQTCILGNAQILQRELPGEGFLRERVDSLLGAARTATELIRELADGAEDGDEAVDVADLVRHAEPLLRAVLPESIELVCRFGHGLPPVAASSEALRRVLLELVVNAAEAKGACPGAIDVELGCDSLDASELPGRIDPAAADAGPCVWIEVRDDGPGLEPGARARLFERGFSTKGDRRGHGLSEAREILARHGGALRVSSRPGKGAAFRILLPVAGAAVA